LTCRGGKRAAHQRFSQTDYLLSTGNATPYFRFPLEALLGYDYISMLESRL
jgi:hypothetical protein